MPNSNWRFYQEWNNAIFLHWEVDESELRKFVPSEIELDLFNGRPWVSLVAFTMERIRPHYLPFFPPVSDFDEINIRTYVKYNGKPGVFFLSIEGGTLLSCKIAKGISDLPYRYSDMNRTKKSFYSKNNMFNDLFEIEYTVGKSLQNKKDIDLWLTERYALYQNTKTHINGYQIHHIEWDLDNVDIHSINLNYSRFDKLLSKKPNKTAYSKGVQVIAWGKEKHIL